MSPAGRTAGPTARPSGHAMRGPQRGLAVVAAIFLLVVLGLLGAMIVALSSTQQVGQARDLAGSSAYFAARTGIEWGVYQVLRNGSCTAGSTLPALGGSATGLTVSVNCTASGPFDEGGNSVLVYKLVSTATRGTPGATDYVDRQLQAVVSTP
jgi:MSHA biogenesis protein MshP